MTVVIDGTSGINTPGVVNTAAETIATTLAVTGVTTLTAGATLQGLTVGLGAGAVATNTAVGFTALAANTSGSNHVAVGYRALSSMTTGNTCVAVGQDALKVSVAGTENTAVGFQSMLSTLTASKNSALGLNSLSNNTTGSNNTAIGHSALTANTTANNNTAVGYQAGKATTTGAQNTFIGTNAGNVVTGSYNTMVGYAAGNVATTGTNNTFIGAGSAGSAGEAITTGAKNVILGAYTGSAAPISATGSNYIAFSDGDGNVKGWFGAGNSNDLFRVGTTSTATPSFMHQIAYSQVSRFVLGITNDVSSGGPSGLEIKYPNVAATAATDYFLYCSNSTTARAIIKNDGGLSNFSANNTNLSDRREKTDFNPAGEYLSKICAIPVQTFRYIDRDTEDTAFTLGVVAQDVQAVAPELVAESDWSSEKDGSKVRLSVYQTDVQYALMKCIQEQQALITQQAAAITSLTTRITALEAA